MCTRRHSSRTTRCVTVIASVSALRRFSAPGHTPGTMSFFFDTEENGVRYRAGMHGGVGVNSMTTEFLNRYHLPFDCREKFFAGLERLKREHVDVPLGNHVHCNDTLGKAARIGSGAGNPFIAPGEWIPFLETCAERLQRQIEAERRR